jgi:hypothetical protein
MVDWSAASKPTTGADSIWISIAKRNVRFQLAYETFNPPTRAEAEKLIDRLLQDFAKRGDRLLLGFDFPMGFPRGTAAALKLEGAPWPALMRFVAGEIKDKADNTNNRFQVAAKINRLMTGGPFPFWGAPAKDVQTTLTAKRPRDHGDTDVPEFRHCDLAAKGASPIWKLYYQGSVGGQALMGMPVVQRLRDARGPAAKVWPFDTGWTALAPTALEGVDLVMAEIYPSLLKPIVSKADIKDEIQVRTAAAHFAGLDEKGALGKAFAPTAAQAALIDCVTAEEGWILGV